MDKLLSLLKVLKNSNNITIKDLDKKSKKEIFQELYVLNRTLNLYNFEKNYYTSKGKVIAGIDEVGRGPIAGPVVAAVVILNNRIIPGIYDSKELTQKEREELCVRITKEALSYGIGIVSHREIDRINIRNATFLAMNRAFKSLTLRPDLVLIDGRDTPLSNIKQEGIIKGDSKTASIAAASIIAKVYRDRIMDEFHRMYPEYLFNENKGYPSKAHIEAIKKKGYAPIHRQTFKLKALEEEA